MLLRDKVARRARAASGLVVAGQVVTGAPREDGLHVRRLEAQRLREVRNSRPQVAELLVGHPAHVVRVHARAAVLGPASQGQHGSVVAHRLGMRACIVQARPSGWLLCARNAMLVVAESYSSLTQRAARAFLGVGGRPDEQRAGVAGLRVQLRRARLDEAVAVRVAAVIQRTGRGLAGLRQWYMITASRVIGHELCSPQNRSVQPVPPKQRHAGNLDMQL